MEKTQAPDSKTTVPPATPPGVPRRGPGHRGQDVRDTVAEMAARAQEISLEAGSKMSAAMKEIIGAAAGLSEFAIESARDLVQYMVRRGQMTQEEADKLILAAEAAHRGRSRAKKGKGARKSGAKKAKPKKKSASKSKKRR
jgi:polyhydroxyalkanoate synthesis regulator phasin